MTALDDAIARMQAHPDAFVLTDKRWTDADVAALASATDLSLPDELALALQKYGYIERDTELYFRAKFADGSEEIGEIQILFSGIDRSLKDYSNIVGDPSYPGRQLSNYVFFGTADGGRSFLLADGKNPGNNTVYYWPLAFDPVGEGDNIRGVAKAADTLAAFIDGLRPREEI